MSETANKQGDQVLMYSEKMLARLLEQIWLALLLVCICAGAASLMRYRVTGWLPIYTFHTSIGLLYLMCYLFRHKLSFNARVGIVIMIFYAIGIAGLFTFGMIGAGTWWLILATLQAKIFYSYRAGLLHIVFSVLLIIAAGVAYTTGLIGVNFNLDSYITSVATWATLVFGCVFISMSIFSSITTYQRAVVSLLMDVVKSKEQIQAQSKEIETLRHMLPICSECKKIKDDGGSWGGIEEYVEKNSTTTFTHSLCPPCSNKLYGDILGTACE